MECTRGLAFKHESLTSVFTSVRYIHCHACKQSLYPFILYLIMAQMNMVLRRIFGPRRDEVTGEWRRLHNEALNDLYSSPNIVRVIKSRKMRWAGHVVRMGEERGCIGSCWGNRREGDYWGDLGVDGLIILGWNSRRWDVGIWTGLGWPRIETGGGRLLVR